MQLYQPTITGSLSVSGSINLTGSLTLAGGGTISGTASIATTALTASSADNFLVRNTLTAQTLVVQTITSSVSTITGSTNFGSLAANTHTFTGSILVSSGSVLNIGRTDNGYPFTVASQFAKTDTTGRGLAFFGSNEVYASNPFGLVITVTGASTLANRVVQIGTTDFGLANGGMLSLQGTLNITGSNVGIGAVNPTTHATASGLVVAGTGGGRGIIEVWDNSATAGKAVFQNVGGITYVGSLSSGSGAGTLALLVGGNGSSATVAMSLLSNGNVGIGTTNPSVKLQIDGSLTLKSNTNQTIQLWNSGSVAANIGGNLEFKGTYRNADNDSVVYSKIFGGKENSSDGNFAGYMSFSTYEYPNSLAERMRITSEGKVGIRTSSPRTILQVTPVSNAETPVLGTATGAVTFTSANTNYGIQFNSTSDGSYFIQSQRFDSSAVAYALGLNPVGGYVYLGKGWGASNHRINLEVAQGNNILVVSAYSGASNDSVIIKAASGANPNATTTVMEVTTNSATGRSISAGGTINASGNDYAEYVEKAVTDAIAKGDIVGINSNAKLTNIFADAISFVVKSTDPSYVGGDAWGNIVGKRPERTTDQTEEEFAPILAEFEVRLEAERAKVDRIAFSGQVPCNVTGANVGDYIIPIELENGKIGGQAVTNPTFEQYQISVGKVWKIMEDGRAWIAVKIG